MYNLLSYDLWKNLIQGVDCKENERCKVESQETADGSWAPPKGVCVEKSDADDCEASS